MMFKKSLLVIVLFGFFESSVMGAVRGSLKVGPDSFGVLERMLNRFVEGTPDPRSYGTEDDYRQALKLELDNECTVLGNLIQEHWLTSFDVIYTEIVRIIDACESRIPEDFYYRHVLSSVLGEFKQTISGVSCYRAVSSDSGDSSDSEMNKEFYQ